MKTDNNYKPLKDTKIKHYIPQNVYQAAKNRIRDAINQSDNQAVLCSGGKDSVCVLHLLREVYNEMNINKKINVIFMDEEVINQSVIDYITQLKNDTAHYNFYWFNIPITCDIYNTGKTREYIQNDPTRRHVREPPSDSITLQKLNIPEGTILTRYQLAEIQAGLFHGKVCLFKGIRTTESLFRLTQVIRRKHSPSIGKHHKKYFESVPIYDWTEKDVFLYYYKNNINYNPIYDHEMYSQVPLRVSTPLHAYNTKTYNNLRKLDPQLYDRIVEVFPDMNHADRYKDINTESKKDFINQYPHTIKGLMWYIDDCYNDPEYNLKVKRKVLWAYKRREQNKKKSGSDVFGGYPLYSLFRLVQRGATMRNIVPTDKPSWNCYKFEGYTREVYDADVKKRGQYYDNRIKR